MKMQRELVAAFGIGLATTLGIGAALGTTSATVKQTLTETAERRVSAEGSGSGQTHHLHGPACAGGLELDFKIAVVPTAEADSVRVDYSITNETDTALDVATVAQLVALDGSVVGSLAPSVEGRARAHSVAKSRVSQTVRQVPKGYYTLSVTALGVAAPGEAAESMQRTTEAEVFLYSDGKQVRIIDYTEWYFKSGAATAVMIDEENN